VAVTNIKLPGVHEKNDRNCRVKAATVEIQQWRKMHLQQTRLSAQHGTEC